MSLRGSAIAEQVVTSRTSGRIALRSARRSTKRIRSVGISRWAVSRLSVRWGLSYRLRLRSIPWWRLVRHDALSWSRIKVRIELIRLVYLHWATLLLLLGFHLHFSIVVLKLCS